MEQERKKEYLYELCERVGEFKEGDKFTHQKKGRRGVVVAYTPSLISDSRPNGCRPLAGSRVTSICAVGTWREAARNQIKATNKQITASYHSLRTKNAAVA